MSTFIVRVQFAHETSGHYTLLSDSLLEKGFTERIKDRDGIEYRLPNGNYLIEMPDSNAKAWVVQVVINVALGVIIDIDVDVDKAPIVLITEAKEKRIFWYGLPKC